MIDLNNEGMREKMMDRGAFATNIQGGPKTLEGKELIMHEFIANTLLRRNSLFDQLLDPRRDINQECGYPETQSISPDDYRQMYDRESIGNKVVKLLPTHCWQEQPSIYEDEDSENVTPFEKSWEELPKTLRQESWFKDEEGNPIWEHLYRADVLSGIGHFGVLLMGFDDGLNMREPVAGFVLPGVERPSSAGATTIGESPLGQGAQKTFDDIWRGTPKAEAVPDFSSMAPMGTDAQYIGVELSPPVTYDKSKRQEGMKLLFLRSFDESLVQITQYEANLANPRFGQPVMYRITLNDPREQHSGVGLPMATVQVHWTRVIHLADNLNSSEIFGVPRQRPVWNRLSDLRKLYGGSAEMYWRGAFPGLSLESHPQLGGDVKFDINDIDTQMNNYANTLQRYIAIGGVAVKTLSPEVVDPSTQIDTQITAICVSLDVPKRILMGTERGSLASSQDDGQWNDVLMARQRNYVTPRVVAPFVDRLIATGCLPEPKDGYHVKWPDLNTANADDQAKLAQTNTAALASYVSGGVDVLIPPLDYLTKFIGMSEEDAKAVLENAMEHMAEANPDNEPLVPGREPLPPQPEPGSAEALAAGGVPMPPMIPGAKGQPPKPFVPPQKPKTPTNAEFFSPMLAGSSLHDLLSNMGNPNHDPATGRFTEGYGRVATGGSAFEAGWQAAEAKEGEEETTTKKPKKTQITIKGADKYLAKKREAAKAAFENLQEAEDRKRKIAHYHEKIANAPLDPKVKARKLERAVKMHTEAHEAVQAAQDAHSEAIKDVVHASDIVESQRLHSKVKKSLQGVAKYHLNRVTDEAVDAAVDKVLKGKPLLPKKGERVAAVKARLKEIAGHALMMVGEVTKDHAKQLVYDSVQTAIQGAADSLISMKNRKFEQRKLKGHGYQPRLGQTIYAGSPSIKPVEKQGFRAPTHPIAGQPRIGHTIFRGPPDQRIPKLYQRSPHMNPANKKSFSQVYNELAKLKPKKQKQQLEILTNELRDEMIDFVINYDPDQPRDDQGRWAKEQAAEASRIALDAIGTATGAVTGEYVGGALGASLGSLIASPIGVPVGAFAGKVVGTAIGAGIGHVSERSIEQLFGEPQHVHYDWEEEDTRGHHPSSLAGNDESDDMNDEDDDENEDDERLEEDDSVLDNEEDEEVEEEE